MSDSYNIENFKKIGEDVRISPLAIIRKPEFCELGSHIGIDNGVTVGTKLIMGDYIHISPFVVIIGSMKSTLILEDFTFLAAGTKVVCGSEDYTGTGLVGAVIPERLRSLFYTTVTFKRFSGCGVNCSIMPGVTLGEGAVLGANSLLTKDAEPWTIYVGSPARPIKTRRRDIIIENAKQLGYE